MASTQTSTGNAPLLSEIRKRYTETTSRKVQLIDSFIVAVLFSGALQFLYVLLVGTFPFNSFLSGFGTSVGLFVLTVSLRMQVDSSKEFKGSSPERAFADYIFCALILFLVAMNFLG